MTETKTVAKKATSTKTPAKKAPAKPRAKKVVAVITPQQRYEMIQYAAYFIAKCNNFEGDPHTYWTEAEAQINNSHPQ
jgi:hypothetical protein